MGESNEQSTSHNETICRLKQLLHSAVAAVLNYSIVEELIAMRTPVHKTKIQLIIGVRLS